MATRCRRHHSTPRSSGQAGARAPNPHHPPTRSPSERWLTIPLHRKFPGRRSGVCGRQCLMAMATTAATEEAPAPRAATVAREARAARTAARAADLAHPATAANAARAADLVAPEALTRARRTEGTATAASTAKGERRAIAICALRSTGRRVPPFSSCQSSRITSIRITNHSLERQPPIILP